MTIRCLLDNCFMILRKQIPRQRTKHLIIQQDNKARLQEQETITIDFEGPKCQLTSK